MVRRSGRVFLDGAEVTDAPPHALAGLGLKRAFQQNAFFAEMSVLDNMAAVLQQARGTGLPRQRSSPPGTETARRRALEAEAAALLRRFGVPAAMHGSRPDSLPYGTQRMLSIALAWGTGAKVLMLDEPAAGLGGEDMLRLRDLLGELKAGGAALVVIEHHMDLIMSVADRIVVLDGRAPPRHGHAARDPGGPARAGGLSGARRMSGAVLEAAGLRVAYGGNLALDLPHLALRPGELVGVVGANGAGKSTLVNALLGWSRGAPRVSGTVKLAGEDVSALPTHARVRRGLLLVPEGGASSPA